MAGLRPIHALAIAATALVAPSALAVAAAHVGAAAVGPAARPSTAILAPSPPRAPAVFRRAAGGAEPDLHVGLRVDRTGSGLTGPELVAILNEVNRIWSQAGICFDATDASGGPEAPRPALRLAFVADDVPFLNGYYEGGRRAWTEDRPKLRRAPTPAEHPAARTAAHELGHALGLRHLPGRPPYIDGLMNTGYDGFQLTPSEIARARRVAADLAHPFAAGSCRPPAL